MNWSNVFTVFRKELRDSLRDRRTLISMIVVPTLVMPMIMFGVGMVMTKIIKKAEAETVTIAIVGGADSPAIVTALRAEPKFRIIPPPADVARAIGDKWLRAAVELPAGFDAALAAGQPTAVKLLHYQGEMKSEMGVGALEGFFRDYRAKLVEHRLAERGLPPELIKPFEVHRQNVAPPEKVGGNWIGGIVAYMIILLCFTGAMYPAMDLTAGEKERGTMETLLCSPVSRSAIVLGKFCMVLTASVATMLMSLVSMGVSAVAGGSLLAGQGMASAAKVAAGSTMPMIDPFGLLGVFAMILPVAVLFSAVEFSLALFAKSYKEAQSYVSPLLIVIILPAMMSMLPGVELNAKLALVPVLNVSLVCKEMLSGVWHWPYLALIFGSTAVYAAAALAFAVAMFKRESVLFRT